MKKTKKIFSSFLAVMLLCSMLTVGASAKGGRLKTAFAVVDASALRLRTAPSTSSTILGLAPRGEYVLILEKVGDWYKVEYNLKTAYMHSDYLILLNAENAEMGYGRVNDTRVNYRTGPGTGYSSLGKLNTGDMVYIIGFNRQWYKAIYDDTICYIRSDYVDLTEIAYENVGAQRDPIFFRNGYPISGTHVSASSLKSSINYTGCWDSTEPEPTEPEPTEPKPTQPEPTEPKPTQPEPTEPKPTQPEPTEPKPTQPAPTEPKPTQPEPTEPEPSQPNVDALRQQIVDTARQYLGTPYLWGGSTPRGFDCSGFTQYVFRQHGISIPRTTTTQCNVGTYVSQDELLPGDLVFLQNTYRDGISHVGIYIGNGQMIHAANAGVLISDLSGAYYVEHYATARRIIQ